MIKDCPSKELKRSHGGTIVSSVRHFALPSDPELRSKWLQNIKFRKRPGNVPLYSFVCCLHFQDHCLLPPDSQGHQKLRENSIPTLLLNFDDDGYVPIHSCHPPDIPQILEHNYSSNISRNPELLARDLKKARLRLEIVAKQQKALQMKASSWKVKAKKVSSLYKNLKELFPKEEVDKVIDGFEDTRLQLIGGLWTKRKKKYSQNVREFASNVFYYRYSYRS